MLGDTTAWGNSPQLEQLAAVQSQVCRLISTCVRQLLCDPSRLGHVSLGGFRRASGSFTGLLWCCCGTGSFGSGPFRSSLAPSGGAVGSELRSEQFQMVPSSCTPAVLSFSQACCLISSVFFLNWRRKYKTLLPAVSD